LALTNKPSQTRPLIVKTGYFWGAFYDVKILCDLDIFYCHKPGVGGNERLS